jgi:hypothetical protein
MVAQGAGRADNVQFLARYAVVKVRRYLTVPAGAVPACCSARIVLAVASYSVEICAGHLRTV